MYKNRAVLIGVPRSNARAMVHGNGSRVGYTPARYKSVFTEVTSIVYKWIFGKIAKTTHKSTTKLVGKKSEIDMYEVLRS